MQNITLNNEYTSGFKSKEWKRFWQKKWDGTPGERGHYWLKKGYELKHQCVIISRDYMEATGHIRKEYESKATGPFGPLYSAFLTDRWRTEHFPWALTGGWTPVTGSVASWDLSGDDSYSRMELLSFSRPSGLCVRNLCSGCISQRVSVPELF